MNSVINHKKYHIIDGSHIPTSNLEKHVKWLKSSNNKIEKISHLALAIIETIAFTLFLPTVFTVLKAHKISNKIDKINTFYENAKTKSKPSIKASPLKSDSYTFNHTFEFTIHEDITWYRNKEGKNEWQPFYYDGFHNNEKPIFIDSDGANLIIIDDQSQIHYKKVLEEYYPDVITGREKYLSGQDIAELKRKDYIAVDLTRQDTNWEEAWFTLPFICKIVNLFTGRRLKLPPNKKVAISHRGRYNHFYNNTAGSKFPVFEGVTTLFVLDNNRRDLLKFDPWSPVWATAKVSLPETDSSAFEAENIATASSTIMAIGYDINFESEKGELKIITRLADIDTEGGNPMLSYSYHERASSVLPYKILPTQPKWQEHTLPKGAEITSNITITQTGEGNDARQMYITGKRDGINGYFTKELSETEWSFQADESITVDRSLESSIVRHDLEPTTVHNYKTVIGEPVIELKNFGNRESYSEVTITVGGKKLDLFLYKRSTLLFYLGSNDQKYDLVIPEEFLGRPEIKELFGDKKSLKVKVKLDESSGIVAILSPNINLPKHKIELKMNS